MLEYCNAGHNPPIIIQAGEARYFAESECTPLGVWDEAEYPSRTMQLAQGDTILLYTDGVTEAKDAANKDFGEAGTLRCVAETSPKTPEQIIDNVLQQVRQHADGSPQSDDITMLCLKYNQCT